MPRKLTYSNGETPNVCIIGAGFSGLCAAIQLRKQLGLTTFTIFESNKDIGGTWFSNTYPGCACDVPSHLYSLSFERNPDWTENYSSQPEIWRYLKKVTEKYELYPNIRLETEVKSLTWDESLMKWRIVSVDKNSNSEQDQLFDVVINGPGALRIPNVPEEFKSFKGPLIHSAEWDSTVELENKVVGIIGSGASAVQIIPSIVNNVKQLHSYQRKKAWIIPRLQGKFSSFWKATFRYFPLTTWLFRSFMFCVVDVLVFGFKYGSRMNLWGRNLALAHIQKQLPGNPDLQETLTPTYAFGCKRLLPSNDFYPALSRSNVTIHTEKIIQVRDHAIVTEDGHLQNLDVLILATGYRVHDYFAPMEILGRNSENILETWKVPASLRSI